MFQSSNQAATRPPVYHTRWTGGGRTLFLVIAERQAGRQ